MFCHSHISSSNTKIQVSNVLISWEDSCSNGKFSRLEVKVAFPIWFKTSVYISSVFKLCSYFSAQLLVLLLPTLVCNVKKLHQAFVWRSRFCRIYKMYPNGWENFSKQQHCLHIHDTFSSEGMLYFENSIISS